MKMRETSWYQELRDFFSSSTYHNVKREVLNTPNVCPPVPHIFNAYKLCPLEKVSVVILGQDPFSQTYKSLQEV